MRRNLAVLAIFVVGSGFHHHHHGSHGGHGSSGMGCGEVHEETSPWRIDGTVRASADDPAHASALLHVRDNKTGAPVHGAVVSVAEQRLVEVAPGEYLGVVRVELGSGVFIEAVGAHTATLSGEVPVAAQNLALATDASAVFFDERGRAERLEVVAHGASQQSQTTTEFEEDARLELPVPHVDALSSVEVRTENTAGGLGLEGEVGLEVSAELAR